MSEAVTNLPTASIDALLNPLGPSASPTQTPTDVSAFLTEIEGQLSQANLWANINGLAEGKLEINPLPPTRLGLLNRQLSVDGPPSSKGTGKDLTLASTPLPDLTTGLRHVLGAGLTATDPVTNPDVDRLPANSNSASPSLALSASQVKSAQSLPPARPLTVSVGTLTTENPAPPVLPGALLALPSQPGLRGTAADATGIPGTSVDQGITAAGIIPGANPPKAYLPNQVANRESINSNEHRLSFGADSPQTANLEPSPAFRQWPTATRPAPIDPGIGTFGFEETTVVKAQVGPANPVTGISHGVGFIPNNTQASPLLTTNALPANGAGLPSPAATQVTDQVKMMIRSDQREARVQLHPRELGAVNIRIALQAEQADVAIEASNPELYREFSNNTARLRQLFINEGLGLNQLALDLGPSSQQQHGPEKGHQSLSQNAAPADQDDANNSTKLVGSNLANKPPMTDGQTLSLYA